MFSLVKSEFRKLLTVRSTYFITIAAYLLLVLVAFYTESYSGGAANLEPGIGRFFLADSIALHSTILGIFGAVIALLLMSYEYRFNTILYTLTAANSRSKVLISKFIVIIIFIFAFNIIGNLLGIGLMLVGVHFAGLNVPHQDFSLVTYLLESLAYCEGYALAAFLFATLMRSQVAALATLLLFPSIIETLLRLLLGSKSVYLPFVALSQIVPMPIMSLHGSIITGSTLSPVKGTAIFLVYLLLGWVVAWRLFLRRGVS